MKRTFAFLLLATAPLGAQDPPRAVPHDPALRPDAGNDFFQRGKNLYDDAQRSTNTSYDNRRVLYERAGDLFNEYLSSFPNHPNAEVAWWYLGNCYYHSGHLEDAKRCFHTLLSRYGQGKWAAAAAYTLAADHYNKGEYDYAAPLFERYATTSGNTEDRPRGHYYAGNCYRMLGRDREAIGAFLKVLKDPSAGTFVPQAQLGLGHLYRKAGKEEEALASFEQVITGSHNPKLRGEAALQASLAAGKLKQGELAEKYLQLILTSPGMEEYRPDAQVVLMTQAFDKKDYAEVVKIFRRSPLKAEGPKESARLMVAARAFMRMKQPSAAMDLFREIERAGPPESDLVFQAAYYRLLCFFQIEGRHVPEQVDGFLKIYRKDRPNDSRIHTALMMKAETLFSNQEVAEAAQVYSQIDASLVSESNRPGLLYQRGWCLAEAGDHQGAIRSLSEFLKAYPADERVLSAYAKRAKAYSEVGEPAKAIEDFNRLTGSDAPSSLASFAWLESARLRRQEGNVEDMMLRYRGLLEHIKDLSAPLQAEANYWIGWGLVKSNQTSEAIPYLEKARTMRPDSYRKHAGILLALGYFAAQDPQKLEEELNVAIQAGYVEDLPDQALQWAGMQAYNSQDYETCARFLERVSTPEEPRETRKEVWRYLGKARLEAGDAKAALIAINNVLEVEDNSGWKADALVDKGRALLLTGKPEEARAVANEAFDLRPQGRTNALLRILSGDLHVQAGELGRAAAEYQYVVDFHEDKDLKPLALHKLIHVLERQHNTAEAQKRRQQLLSEFPEWKPQPSDES